MKKAIRIIGALSLLLLVASFPTCYLGERMVQPELSKLSPGESELRQFDIEYVRYVLPGIAMFFAGAALAVVAVALRVAEYLMVRQQKGAGRGL